MNRIALAVECSFKMRRVLCVGQSALNIQRHVLSCRHSLPISVIGTCTALQKTRNEKDSILYTSETKECSNGWWAGGGVQYTEHEEFSPTSKTNFTRKSREGKSIKGDALLVDLVRSLHLSAVHAENDGKIEYFPVKSQRICVRGILLRATASSPTVALVYQSFPHPSPVHCIAALSSWSLFLVPLRAPWSVGGAIAGRLSKLPNTTTKITEVPLSSMLEVGIVSAFENLKTFADHEANSISRPFRVLCASTTHPASDEDVHNNEFIDDTKSDRSTSNKARHDGHSHSRSVGKGERVLTFVGFEVVCRLRHYLMVARESWAMRSTVAFRGGIVQVLTSAVRAAKRYLSGIHDAITGQLGNQVGTCVQTSTICCTHKEYCTRNPVGFLGWSMQLNETSWLVPNISENSIFSVPFPRFLCPIRKNRRGQWRSLSGARAGRHYGGSCRRTSP